MAAFIHEVVESSLKDLASVYQTMINSLIEGFEKIAYLEKEGFIDFTVRLTEKSKLETQIMLKHSRSQL